MASANTAPSKTKKAVTKNAASTKSNKSTKATKATLGKAKAKTTATPIFPNLAGGTIAAPTAAGNSAPAASSGTAAAATNKAPSKRKKLLHQSSSDSEDSDNEAPPPKRTKKAAGKEIATKAKGKTPATKQASKKRRANDEEDGTEASEAPAAKKFKVARDEKAVKATKAKPAPKAKPKVVINNAPTDRLNVYVFGEGSSGELGLGTAKNAIDVKRPRLNAFLSAEKVGVVQIACGGMHVAALTHDGKVMTWGVNDQGALGRDTNWEGGLRDVGESDSESDSGSDSGLNPRESTPTAVTTFPPCVVIVKLCAGDSHTLALTDDGQVYGWGTFRVSERYLYHLLITFANHSSRTMKAFLVSSRTPMSSTLLSFSLTSRTSWTSLQAPIMLSLLIKKASSTLGALANKISLASA